jgi:outer membrane protein OmpA-like peptidoglycan-associated protein
MVDPKVRKQRATVQQGQPAVIRAIGLPHIKDPVRETSRRVSPDATGFYESDPLGDTWNSNRILQVNQAGKALVAWFTPPPHFVQPVQPFAICCAVLIADLTTQRAGGFSFFYRVIDADNLAGVDPVCVLSPFDPWDQDAPPVRLGADKRALGQGFIKFALMQNPGGWDFLSPRLTATIRFDLEDQSNATMTMNQTQPTARAAERTIGAQAPSLKNALIVRHQRPVPSTFFDTDKPCGRVWKQARDLFKSPDGPIAVQITAYFDNEGDGVDKLAKREAAMNAIAGLLTFPWDAAPHAKWLDTLLTRDACTSTFQIDKTNPSLRDWLAKICAAEVERHRMDGVTYDATLEIYPKVFDKVLGGAKLYCYELAFSATSMAKDLLPLLRGAGGVFEVTVTAKEAPAKSDGAMPSDADFRKMSESNHATFVGAFVELKGGNGDSPKLPELIRFVSGEQLNSTDFMGAVFEVYALDAGVTFFKAGVKTPLMSPHIMPNSGMDTQFMRLHVKEQVLDATFSEMNVVPDWGGSWGLHVPKGGDLKPIFNSHGTAVDTDFANRDVDGPKVSAGVSVGAGFFGASDGRTLSNWLKPPPLVTGGQQQAGDGRSLTAAFAKASAVLDTKVKNWDIKVLLELMWAVDLALFNGAPSVDIKGHASPEYIPQYNLLLSMKRAQAVKFAMEDAVGPFSEGQIVWNGEGDARAKAAGFIEPDTTGKPMDRATYLKTHAGAEEKWKQFRMVEVDIRGTFSLRVVTFDGHDFQ